MKKIVVILVMALFAINVSFSQDSLQTELNEFKKFVHYCKIHNTEIVNIDPIAISDIVKRTSNKKVEKLLFKLVEKSKRTFRTRQLDFFKEGARENSFCTLAYQSSENELYLLKIVGQRVFLYKTTKVDFNKLNDQDLFLLAEFGADDNYSFNEEGVKTYASETTVKRIIAYMSILNSMSVSYTID